MDRKTLGAHLAATVAAQRAAADTIAARVTMGTAPAWMGKLRPDHYRRTTTEAIEALHQVAAALGELDDLLTYYRLLWPEAHDDNIDLPGYCTCGRWAETCPARQAADAGELTWTDEAGTEHALADADTAEEQPPTEQAAEAT